MAQVEAPEIESNQYSIPSAGTDYPSLISVIACIGSSQLQRHSGDESPVSVANQPGANIFDSMHNTANLDTDRSTGEEGFLRDGKYDNGNITDVSQAQATSATTAATSEVSAETLSGSSPASLEEEHNSLKFANCNSISDQDHQRKYPAEHTKPGTAKLRSQASLPHSIESLSGTIRMAVEKSHIQGIIDVVTPTEVVSQKVDIPPSDVDIELSDELREFIENTLNKPELLAHSESKISINTLMREITAFNKLRPFTERVNPTSIVQKCPIVKRSAVVAEVYLEALPPCEQLRLRSSERSYQRWLGGNPALRRFGSNGVDERTKDCLSIELRGSVAMSTSLIVGPFLAFLAGYAIPELLGVHNVSTQAISGLCTCLICFAVEMGLILIRYAKLAKIKDQQSKRRARRLENARRNKSIVTSHSSNISSKA